MSKLRWFSIVCMLALMSPKLVLAADGGDYTIRSNPSEVRVLFTAMDSQGRRISQLEPKDVAVLDNGEVIRRFRSFGSASETPLNVVILVDTSDSVAKQVAGVLESVQAFIHSSKWLAGDQISVLVFNGTRADVICSRNCREQAPIPAKSSKGNTTPLYDALLTASELIARTADGARRSAIILLSDGNDNISTHGLTQAIAAAQSVDASVYTLNLRAQRADAQSDAVLERIATETGGVAYGPGRGTAEALDAVLDDLRQGFVLTYECPRNVAVRHGVRVVPALNSRLRFRSRQSYIGSTVGR